MRKYLAQPRLCMQGVGMQNEMRDMEIENIPSFVIEFYANKGRKWRVWSQYPAGFEGGGWWVNNTYKEKHHVLKLFKDRKSADAACEMLNTMAEGFQ